MDTTCGPYSDDELDYIRWEQDLIRDRWGKFLYVRDRDTDEFCR